MNPDFPRTTARLKYEIDEDQLTRGAQVVVEVKGEPLYAFAVGDNGRGAPMLSTTLLRAYCTTKPFVAVAVAGLVGDGRLHLDSPLLELLPDLRVLDGGVTARHVLTHTAGLDVVRGYDLELLPLERRRDRVARSTRRVGFRIGRDAAYSEAAGWHVLGWLIEAVAAEPLRPYLRRTVLEPLGLESTFIGMTEQDYERVEPSLGINIDTRAQTFMPMVFERTRRVCCETNPAFGGYTTAGDLARFFSALLAQRAGRGSGALPPPAVLREFTSEARPPTFDEILDRECPFGLGFMTSLADHEFGADCGPATFGHSGYVGSSFAFADPDRDLAVGVLFNGVVTHESAFLRRRALIRALYADLEGDEPDGTADDARELARARPRRRWLSRHRAD